MGLALLSLLLAQQSLNPYSGITWSNPLPGQLDATLYRRIGSRAAQQKLWPAAAKAPPAVEKPAPKAPLTATDFKPAGPRSVAGQLVVGWRGLTKEQRLALVQGLNAGIDAFEKEARKHNVAYAIAFLFGVALQVLGDTEVPDAQAEALAQLINDELAASPAYQKTDTTQRQQLYEICIVVGALIGGMAAEAAETGDAALKAQTKQMARSVLETFSPK